MSDPIEQALQLQRDAAGQGFDWSEAADLWPKLAEEVAELQAATGESHARVVEEFGDVLFMMINIARHFGLSPSQALAAANSKFQRRFSYVMSHADVFPPPGDPARLEAMERFWQQAKQQGL